MIESQKSFNGRDVFKTMTLHGIYCILVQGKEDVRVKSNANTTVERKNEKLLGIEEMASGKRRWAGIDLLV